MHAARSLDYPVEFDRLVKPELLPVHKMKRAVHEMSLA
jgi:hypothetical protein